MRTIMTSLGAALHGGGKSWGQLLTEERRRHPARYTVKDLARKVGVAVETVEAWEANEAVPNGQTLGRLYATVAGMGRYGLQLAELRRKLEAKAEHDPPTEPTKPEPTIAGQEASAPEPTIAGQEASAPEPKAHRWATFGLALAERRVDVGFMQHQIAAMVGPGVTQWDVSRWEQNKLRPTEEEQAKLLELFPELAEAPPPVGAPRSARKVRATSRAWDIRSPEPTPQESLTQIDQEAQKEHAMPTPMPSKIDESPKAASANQSLPLGAAEFRRYLEATRSLRKSKARQAIAELLRSSEWLLLLDAYELGKRLGLSSKDLAEEVGVGP